MILDDLVINYQKTKDVKVLNMIIDKCKNLLTYFTNKDLYLESDEIYELALEALYDSILRYNGSYNKDFQNFACHNIKYYVLNNVRRNNNSNPLYENFLIAKGIIEEKFGITLEKDFSLFDYIIDYMVENKLIREKYRDLVKKKLLLFLKRGYYEYMRLGNIVDSGELDAFLIGEISNQELRDRLDKLDYRTREIIKERYGIDTEPKKLSEIALDFKYSINAVRKRIQKGLETLQDDYKGVKYD